MRNHFGSMVLVPVIAAFAVACGGGGPGEPQPVTGGIVMGTVSDLYGTPIEGAEVTIAGRMTQSNPHGWFNVAGIAAAERLVIRASRAGSFDAVEAVTVRDGATTWVELRIPPVQQTVTVDPATGGDVVASGHTVRFPSNAFVDERTGAAVTEPVSVAISAYDYSNESDIDAFPGDFVGRDRAGIEQPLESLGFLKVELRTASGARVAIAPGTSVELRLDSALSATAPDVVPLWYFDEAAGLWVEDGQATRQGTALVGSVTHFTAWNYDITYDASFLTGRVVDLAGNPLPYAHVEHQGVDYRGGSARDADANGNFRLPVNPNRQARVWAVYRGHRSVPIVVETPPAGMTSYIGDLVIADLDGAINATFTLSWGAEPNDLDAHLYTPSGAHVYYGSRGSLSEAPFAQLNTDDTSSYGPEITTITRLENGSYLYCVHNYSGSPGFDRSNAIVTYSDARGVIQQLAAPTSASDLRWWRVARLEASDGRVSAVHFDGSLVAGCAD